MEELFQSKYWIISDVVTNGRKSCHVETLSTSFNADRNRMLQKTGLWVLLYLKCPPTQPALNREALVWFLLWPRTITVFPGCNNKKLRQSWRRESKPHCFPDVMLNIRLQNCYFTQPHLTSNQSIGKRTNKITSITCREDLMCGWATSLDFFFCLGIDKWSQSGRHTPVGDSRPLWGRKKRWVLRPSKNHNCKKNTGKHSRTIKEQL